MEPLDPKTLTVGRALKMTREMVERRLSRASREIPKLLIHGYSVDTAILALYDALEDEGWMTEEEIWERIAVGITVAYIGLGRDN